MALFALFVTVPAFQVIKIGHGDRKSFITTSYRLNAATMNKTPKPLHESNKKPTSPKPGEAGFHFTLTTLIMEIRPIRHFFDDAGADDEVAEMFTVKTLFRIAG